MPLMNSMLGMTDEELNQLQLGLGVSGMTPGVGNLADLADAGISAGRGDLLGTILGLGAAIPGLGMVLGAGRGLSRAAEQTEAAADIVKPFYSTAFEAAKGLKQEKFKPQSVRNVLEKAGVKHDELDFLNLGKVPLDAKGKVTKQSLVDHISANQIPTEDQWLTRGVPSGNSARTQELEEEYADLVHQEDMLETVITDIEEGYGTVRGGHQRLEVGSPEQAAELERLQVDRVRIEESLQATEDELEQLRSLGTATSAPRYGAMTMPGQKENYRELLIRFPRGEFRPKRLGADPRGLLGKSKTYEETHWRGGLGENVFVHVRVSDRFNHDGERILFIEEMQSTLHQRGKKFGYYSADHPLYKELKVAQKERDALQARLMETPMRRGGVQGEVPPPELSTAPIRSPISPEDISGEIPTAPPMAMHRGPFTDYSDILDKARIDVLTSEGRYVTGNSPRRGPPGRREMTRRGIVQQREDIFGPMFGPGGVAGQIGFSLTKQGMPRAFVKDYQKLENKVESIRRKIEKLEEHAMPDAPFKKNWAEYAFKKIVREASESERGYTHVAWNHGDSVQNIVGGKLGGQRLFYNEKINNVASKLGKVNDIDIGGVTENAGSLVAYFKNHATSYVDPLDLSGNTRYARRSPQGLETAAREAFDAIGKRLYLVDQGRPGDVGVLFSSRDRELEDIKRYVLEEWEKYPAFTGEAEEMGKLTARANVLKKLERKFQEVLDLKRGEATPRSSIRLSDTSKLSEGIRHHSLYKGFPMIAAGGVAASPLISKIADNDPTIMEEI